MAHKELAHWDDANILKGVRESRKDLEAASIEQPNSEWHECCFAAAVVFAEEAAQRGILSNATQPPADKEARDAA